MVETLRSYLEGTFSPETCFRFQLCVSETLTNLSIHAQTNASACPIEIRLDLETASAKIQIFDPEGVKPFDLRKHATDLSKIDVMSEGGRGLSLIMECADVVDYSQSATDTRYRLSLTFRDDQKLEIKPFPSTEHQDEH